MSVQRIVNPKSYTDGFQARVPKPNQPRKYWSRFFSIKTYGARRARALAKEAEFEFLLRRRFT